MVWVVKTLVTTGAENAVYALYVVLLLPGEERVKNIKRVSAR